VCSVALGRDGLLLALREDRSNEYTHAEQLNSFIQEVMEEAALEFADLDAVAVSQGPGSYTGLRIGVSTAKGLAYACNLKLIAADTLESMTARFLDDQAKSLFIPMIDARRMEVFCKGFSGKGEKVFNTRAEILSLDSFPEADRFERKFFFGDGAEKAVELLEPRGFTFFDEVDASSAGMLGLAEKKYQQGEFEDLAYFEPFYLKDFVAGKKKKSAG
jgi:tRNA threonylcarbamoyladenosine biosynthesis protein TsaB